MVETENVQLNKLLEQALEKAISSKNQILVSFTEPIRWKSPIDFYELGSGSDRIFWRNPTGEIFVGLGKEIVIDANVSRNWKKLIDNAIYIENNMRIFGGFSFDRGKEKTKLWDGFLDEQFILPSLMLYIKEGNISLTSNFLVKSTDNIDELLSRFHHKMEKVYTLEEFSYEPNKIVKHVEVNPDTWIASVEDVISNIKESKAEKVVLAREWKLELEKTGNSTGILHNLLEQQYHSYVFAFDIDGACFVGATPERLIKKQGLEVESMCLAGSYKKGTTVEETNLNKNILLQDDKNRKEHQFVVDTIKSSLSCICEQIDIPEVPDVLEMKNILHLHTPVKGKISESISLIDLMKVLHPTPALGGYPKQESLQIIREKEELDRGWYGAPIGFIDGNMDGELAVAIRSGIMRGREISLFAGCGIVANSIPEDEYEETKVKFTPMISALGGNIHELY